MQQCRGQGYDGASNMMGRLSGVARKFLEIQSSALPVHCLAHCTNLVLQDLCKAIKTIREVLKLVKDISRLIRFSPKNEILFVENQINASGHLESGEEPTVCKTVKPLCVTRWTVRTEAIDSILKNYSVLRQTLFDINEHQHDDNGITAGGIADLMGNFRIFWGLKLSHLIFSAAEQLSISVQGKDTSAQEAQRACKAAREYYKRLRKQVEYDSFFDEAVKQAALVEIEPDLQAQKN